ncbi:FAD-dependent urate hydroxylase HpxO [Thioclava sp. GXIMD4215]|uniref:FAD-dependent urate hydroxylase HpxO n=1 Tax=Thioclava sp. GXIMD4215 TaxID=3131928 RepID=UPI00311ACCC1
MSTKTVMIIGAGIGGLCAGIALRRIGFEVRIFEKVREVRPVGAGLSLWPNGIQCLHHLGLGAQIRDLGGQMERMAYIDGLTGETMCAFPLTPLWNSAGIRGYPVARAATQEMLMDVFGREHIALGMRLVALQEEGAQVLARFADGTESRADFVIGADGAHSLVRDHLLGPLERRYAGYVNWNGIVDMDAAIAPADCWTTFVAQGKRASIMPIGAGENGQGRFYFFFDQPMPAGDTPAREDYKSLLQGCFSGWAEPVQRLIAAADAGAINRVEIHDIDPFSTWAKGRICLLGDSAHNTTPDLGQGACMAIEDAVVLEEKLRGTDDIPAALQAYQQARAARCADLVLRARARCDVTHGVDPVVTERWYDELRHETGAAILAGIAKTVEGSPVYAEFAAG